MRQKPFLLDFIFENLIAYDDDIAKNWGQKEIDRAKKFFLSTDIDIRMQYNNDTIKTPCVSIELRNSQEIKDKAILGDIAAPVFNETIDDFNYVNQPRNLSGTFPSVVYDSDTGLVTLPGGFTTDLIFAGQALYAPKSQTEYLISKINLANSNSFYIENGVVDDFANGYITPAYQSLKVIREIAYFQENYVFKVMVLGDAAELIWLHTIISYLALKFRREKLERKNIFVSSIASGPVEQADPSQYGGQNFYYREISMDAITEVTWVKEISDYIEGTTVSITATVES